MGGHQGKREQEGKKREEEGMKVEGEGRREGGKKKAKEQEREGERKGGRRGREAERKKRSGWEGGRRLGPAEPTLTSQANLLPGGEEKTGLLHQCLPMGMGGLTCFCVEQEVA